VVQPAEQQNQEVESARTHVRDAEALELRHPLETFLTNHCVEVFDLWKILGIAVLLAEFSHVRLEMPLLH
jgi:hypothetical protein